MAEVQDGWLTEVLRGLQDRAELPLTPAGAWEARTLARAALAEYAGSHGHPPAPTWAREAP